MRPWTGYNNFAFFYKMKETANKDAKLYFGVCISVFDVPEDSAQVYKSFMSNV
jgi:hypothetical protein